MEYVHNLIWLCPLLFIAGFIDSIAGGGGLIALPALYPNERKGVRKALTIGTGMFFIGVLMGYFMVYPLTLRFLSTYQLSSEVENILSLNSYIDNFMMLILCMGLAFELPLVTWLLWERA